MGRKIDPDKEIVVTCGSTEAMMAAMLTVADPGDKVIVFSPFYENYGADTILSGAEPIYVPLYPPEFHFDPSELEAAFEQHPKALILCNPSNPCGKVFTREELLLIAELAEKHDVFVITDEVYEHIVYDAVPAHLFRFSSADVGADDLLLVALQNLLRHGLAAGLYPRAGAYRGRGQKGSRFSDRRRGGPLAGGGGHGTALRRRILQAASRHLYA